ncbi:MAG: methionyl-tRNA formyltransferase [Flavobacteriaceae bacterium]|nr:methionyl-tRNA formyltransferase [Flavobacteriaceae bacterium]
MKSNLRVLFMGTPDFAVHILRSIHQAGYNIVGVVSVPDKPAGRGQKILESSVTQFAKENQLNLLQPSKLKSKKFISELNDLQVDVAVVVAFRMLPEVIWQIPKLATFNLHASLLPQYRGAAPINWAIINGENETGVTTFLIDKYIDTGHILLQQKIDILPNETAGELHDKLMFAGAELVLETLRGIEEGTLLPQKQNNKFPLQAAPKIYRDDCKINWNLPLEQIHNFIRGLSPYPAAWTIFSHLEDKKILKIYKSSIQYRDHILMPKQFIIENNRLGITHPEGIVWLDELQLEGKKRLKAREFINGISISEETQVVD